MPQSSAIFAFIAVAFVVFITQRGSLRNYMGFLFGTVQSTAVAEAPTNSQSAENGSPLNAVAQLLPFALAVV